MKKILFGREQIAEKIKELAKILSEDYADKNPLFVCILKGAVMFFADLTREMSIDLEMDFAALSSYGSKTESGGVVAITKDLSVCVERRHVVLVEDIVDSGFTVLKLLRILEGRGAASVKTVCLLDKPVNRKTDVKPDYACFEIPDAFAVGYGLDFDQKYRNLKDIWGMNK